jgi:hypothetical protein
VDNIKAIIFIPQAVEDITDFESIISDAKPCDGESLREVMRWMRDRRVDQI